MVWATLLLALRALRRNLLRSLLTTLGIVIGVSAVVTMVTLGRGATASVSEQISSLGSNLLILRAGQRPGPGSSQSAPALKPDDLQAIEQQISGLAALAPTVSKGITVVVAAHNWSTQATGTDNGYFQAGNWTLAAGRGFDDAELRSGRAVCVLGDKVRRELFGRQNPVGADLRVKDFSCNVVGLLAAKGQGAMGNDQDDLVVMPLRTVQRRLAGSSDLGGVMLSVREASDTDRVKAQLEALMRERRKIGPGQNDDFNVMDTKQLADALSGTIRTMTTLLGAVAAVSLLVGGIGIMNIMLVSVTERTREIGIRLAIGAFEHEVLLQFLIEAVVLSAFGGLVGIVLATAASVGLSQLMNLPYHFDPQINLLAFAFSAGIGVVFGYFPARRAARLDPIEALRHE